MAALHGDASSLDRELRAKLPNMTFHGPIGSTITLTDARWALAVESLLGNKYRRLFVHAVVVVCALMTLRYFLYLFASISTMYARFMQS
jgi:hypothetical protein